jgi:hypothetical protein
MPFGLQRGDGVIKLHTNLAAHRHDHGLARLRLVALFKVGHQIIGHTFYAGLGPHYLSQRSPPALELRLGVLLLVLGKLLHFIVNGGQVFVFQAQLGQAALVIDGDRGAVVLGLLHVIDMDVVAKHRAGVTVRTADWRASKRDESDIGQSVAQVLGVAHLVAGFVLRRGKLSTVRSHCAVPRCYRISSWSRNILDGFRHFSRLNFGFTAILRAVRFIVDHHNVVPVISCVLDLYFKSTCLNNVFKFQ